MKTKTGALPHSAGFPGTNKISKSWIKTQEDLFAEKIRQEDEEFFARTFLGREFMRDKEIISLTLRGAEPFILEDLTREELIKAITKLTKK